MSPFTHNPGRCATFKEGLKSLSEIMAYAFLYILGTLSGNIVVGTVMIVLLFVFASLGLQTLTWWMIAMAVSLVALIGYERWRRKR
jgi:hypothetical protein